MGEHEVVVKSKSRDATRKRQRSKDKQEEVEEDEIYVALTQEDQEAMQAPANLVPWGQDAELRHAEDSYSPSNVINKTQEKSIEALLDQQAEQERARIMAQEREYQASVKAAKQSDEIDAELLLKGALLLGGAIAGYYFMKWLFASSPKAAAAQAQAAPVAQNSSKAAAALSNVLSEVSQ